MALLFSTLHWFGYEDWHDYDDTEDTTIYRYIQYIIIITIYLLHVSNSLGRYPSPLGLLVSDSIVGRLWTSPARRSRLAHRCHCDWLTDYEG